MYLLALHNLFLILSSQLVARKLAERRSGVQEIERRREELCGEERACACSRERGTEEHNDVKTDAEAEVGTRIDDASTKDRVSDRCNNAADPDQSSKALVSKQAPCQDQTLFQLLVIDISIRAENNPLSF